MKRHLTRFGMTVILVACMGSFCSCSTAKEAAVEGPPAVKINKVAALLKKLKPALSIANESALIEYRGTCGESKSAGNYVRFPLIKLQPPPDNASGLVALRAILPKEADVKAGESGVTVKLGKVWDSLLQTKVRHFVLNNYERYSPALAISAMLHTPAMQRAADELHVHYTTKIFALTGSFPEKDESHLPALIRDMTAADFLRTLAKAFRGIVVYGVCMRSNGKPLVDISFGGSIGARE